MCLYSLCLSLESPASLVKDVKKKKKKIALNEGGFPFSRLLFVVLPKFYSTHENVKSLYNSKKKKEKETKRRNLIFQYWVGKLAQLIL